MIHIDYSIIPIDGKKLYLSEKPANDEEIPYFIDFYNKNAIETIIVLIPHEDLAFFYNTDLLKSYRDNGLHVIHFPISDYSIPDQMASFHSLILDALSRLKDGNLLIHCSAGIGRTGLVASGILISRGLTAKDAISRVRDYRPGAVENDLQREFLESYSESSQSSSSSNSSTSIATPSSSNSSRSSSS